MSNKVDVVRRGDFYDVYFYEGKNRVKYGSGSWGNAETAKIFYQLEGYEVKVYE